MMSSGQNSIAKFCVIGGTNESDPGFWMTTASILIHSNESSSKESQSDREDKFTQVTEPGLAWFMQQMT